MEVNEDESMKGLSFCAERLMVAIKNSFIFYLQIIKNL